DGSPLSEFATDCGGWTSEDSKTIAVAGVLSQSTLQWLAFNTNACNTPLRLYCFQVGDDTDGDGLTDREELILGTLPDVADTDEDGNSDGLEYWDNSTDPTIPDSND
ncbi:MAG: hypothetical protein AAFX99_13015, partial [Myxococcota bacterium]